MLRTKPCSHCAAPYSPGSSNQKLCEDCCPQAESKRWWQLIKRYGVDKQMFEAMYFDQDGTCPLCLQREAVWVDHDHITSKVRGLVCSLCNVALGAVDTYDGWLARTAAYLE